MKHGHGGYTRGQCRCEVCRAAYATYKRDLYRRTAQGLVKPRRLKDVCKWGHLIADVGRYPSGACKGCDRDMRNLRRSPDPHHVATRRLRVIAHNQANAATAWLAWRGCKPDSATTMARRLFTQDWITIHVADSWSIALGTHLAIVYPELYLTEHAS